MFMCQVMCPPPRARAVLTPDPPRPARPQAMNVNTLYGAIGVAAMLSLTTVTTTPSQPSPPVPTASPAAATCGPIDLAFLVDGSSSVPVSNWTSMTSFIEAVAAKFLVGLDPRWR